MAFWEVAGRSGGLLLAPFSATVGALWELTQSGELPQAFVLSNTALVLGLAVTLPLGIVVGLALGRSRALDRWLGVFLDIALVTPTIALVPVIVVALGIDLTARVTMVVFFAVPFLVVNLRSGVRGVDPAYVEMARSFGATELQLWRRVIVPGMLPAFAAGLRIAVSRAVVGMVIVELTLVSVGLGSLIQNNRALFIPAKVFAVTAVIIAEGLALLRLTREIERRVSPRGLHGSSA